jgi:hypothetical protein
MPALYLFGLKRMHCDVFSPAADSADALIDDVMVISFCEHDEITSLLKMEMRQHRAIHVHIIDSMFFIKRGARENWSGVNGAWMIRKR